jgi:hypothetical protein
MLNDDNEPIDNKTLTEVDVRAGVKVGDFELGGRVSAKNNIYKIKVKRGGFTVVSLEGGLYTALIRRLLNGTVRYAILNNSTGQTTEVGELP